MVQKNNRKQQVYIAVLELLSEGVNVKEITTPMIANKCNVGKATLYDYFATKEDMIREAIVFNVSNLMGKFNEDEMKEKGVRTYMKEGFKTLKIVAKPLMTITYNFSIYDLHQYFKGNEENFKAISIEFDSCVKKIIQEFEKENLIHITNYSQTYFSFVALFKEYYSSQECNKKSKIAFDDVIELFIRANQ